MEVFELKNPASPAGMLVAEFGNCVFNFLDHKGLLTIECEIVHDGKLYATFTHDRSLYENEDFVMILDGSEAVSEMTTDNGWIETQIIA